MKHLDKLKHFTYTFTLAVMVSFFISIGWGVVIAALLGLAKEIYDHHQPRNRFCWWDMASNGVGLVVAIYIMRGWGV